MQFKIKNGVLLRLRDIDAKSVIVPSRVRIIGECAFEKCERLQHVTLPASLEEIGVYAFSECRALQEVSFSQETKQPLVIRDRAFCGCGHLERVVLPEAVSAIGSYAFSDCTHLRFLAPASYTGEGVHLPEGFSALGNQVFEDCFSLPSVHLPSTMQSCGKQVLRGCRKLKEICISIPDGSEYRFPVMKPDSMLDVLLLQNYDEIGFSPELTCLLGHMLINGYRRPAITSWLAEHRNAFYRNPVVLNMVIQEELLPEFLQCEELTEVWRQEDTTALLSKLLQDTTCLTSLRNAKTLKDVLHWRCLEQHCTGRQLEKLIICLIGAADDPDINPEIGLYRMMFTGRIKKRTEPKPRDTGKLIALLEKDGIAGLLPDAILEKLAVLANEKAEYELQLFWLGHRKNSGIEDRFGIIERFDL